jgi:hypothetical protein
MSHMDKLHRIVTNHHRTTAGATKNHRTIIPASGTLHSQISTGVPG